MPHSIETRPIHLGLDATAVVQPPFTGVEWYQGYGQRHDADGKEGRLVAMHRFTEPWDAWEMHPMGHEVVLCLEGTLTLIQEFDGEQVKTPLLPGEYAINPPGVWHTADVDGPAAALFITAGVGTEHRAR